jgi:hypothetical protein
MTIQTDHIDQPSTQPARVGLQPQAAPTGPGIQINNRAKMTIDYWRKSQLLAFGY